MSSRNDKVQSQTAIATKWSTITEIAAKIVAPVTNMILARILTPECFGVIATVTMVVSFADLFTDAGFQKFLIQHRFKDTDDLDKSTTVAFWTNLLISIVAWCIILIFNEQLASLVGSPGLGIVIVISALSLPLTSFSSIQMARYKRDFDFKTLFFVRLVSVLLPFVVTVPLAFATKSYWALVVGTLAGGLSNAIILTVCSKWKPTFYYSFKRLKAMFFYSWWILVESILVWLSSYIGVFIVGSFLSSYYLGIYKTSMTTVNQIIGLVTASTSAPLFSALSALQGNKAAFNNLYRKYMAAISFLVIPMGVGIFLYKDLVTQLLLGTQWLEAADFIGLWGLTSALCLVFGTYFNGYYNAMGKPKLSVLAQFLHIVALIPVLIWSSQRSFETLCIARSLVRLELIVVQFIIMKVVFRFPILKLVKSTVPTFIGTAAMTIVSLALSAISHGPVFSIIAILICAIFYLLFMLYFYKSYFYDSLEILGFNFLRVIKNKFFGKHPGKG